MAHHLVTRKMLREGITLDAGSHVLHLVGDRLHIRLDMDPEEEATLDDKFTLIGVRGKAREFEQVKTTKDDTTKGDHFVDLVFSDLVPELSYSLEIDPGQDGSKYFCFENVPWARFEKILRFRE